jgi:N-acetyl sugar amidotransferase
MPAYCRSCVLPDTRPGVRLDADGICAGCRYAEHKRVMDWSERAAAFKEVVRAAKARNRPYDCVIPVSGGKDSYWQVVTCLEHGLHPLCVTYVYPGRTALGERNLRQLVRLGVDHLDLRVNPEVERHFIAKAFNRFGISGLPAHMAIYAWPVQIAVERGIPLVIYGENSAFEYGTRDESLIGARVDRKWLKAFGVTAGTVAEDWVDEVLTEQALAPFRLPSDEQLAARDVRALFLGYYFKWDPHNSRRIAMSHGFEARAEGARVGHYDFVNIDDDFIGVHHHPKWHKYGMTRSWDTLSMDIRAGRLDRAQAIARLRALGDETPWADIELFCRYLGIARAEYFTVVEGFRNRELWSRRGERWTIDHFLLPDYPWPADIAAAA